MKGAEIYDEKLKLRPLVILEKMEEVKENSPKKLEVQLNKKKQNKRYIRKRKIAFLANLGLVPSRCLKKQPANEETKFCCAGFGGMTKCQQLTNEVGHLDSSLPRSFDGKQLTMNHLNLNPRICVKKWLGGDRVVNSKKKFKILENSLIPKTRNHYYCREKPKTHLCSVNGDADFPTTGVSFAENSTEQTERASPLLLKISQQKSDDKRQKSDNVMNSTDRLLRSSGTLELSNGLSLSKWSAQEIKEGKQFIGHFGKGYKANINLKEVRICLKRCKGEVTKVLPKEIRL